MKYIFILRLLAQDPETGDIFWDEAVRAENLSFQVCIENLVITVNTLQDAGIQHEVFCKEQVEEVEEETEDK